MYYNIHTYIYNESRLNRPESVSLTLLAHQFISSFFHDAVIGITNELFFIDAVQNLAKFFFTDLVPEFERLPDLGKKTSTHKKHTYICIYIPCMSHYREES